MLLALLLAACVRPAAHEWVEISQTHYKKPDNFPTNTGDRIFYPAEATSENTRHFYSAQEDIITDNRRYPDQIRPFEDPDEYTQDIPGRTVYPNRSITEHKWQQEDYRIGNIKRVNEVKTNVKANVTPAFSVEVFGEVTEETPEFVTVTRDQEAIPAVIERVANKGSVRRVQLGNTPVKSSSITITKVNAVRRNDIKQHGFASIDSDISDEFQIKDDIFKVSHSSMAPTNNIRRVSSNKETPFLKYDRTTTSWPTSEATIPFQRHSQIAGENKISNNVTRNKTKITKIRNYSTPNSLIEENTVTEDLNTEPPDTVEVSKKVLQDTIVTNSKKIYKAEEIEEELTTHTNPKNSRNANNKGHENIQIQNKSNKAKPVVKENGKGSENPTNDKVKVNTMENMMKFLKVVTETISKNTRRGVNGKVKYLHDLKDSLLSSIKSRIDATWPDDSPRGRNARSAEARGHVEFPSSESSLMTISFLTFAVFLIKLVLQVIQTYKHKTMMMAPLVVATAGRKLRKT